LNFSDLTDLLKKELGIEHLADIARELDVSPQAVSNWKARNRVPYKYIKKLRKQFSKVHNDLEQNDMLDKVIDKGFAKNTNPYDSYDESISLTDIILVLAQQLKIIIITPTIFCFIAIIYTLFFVQPVFESTSKIMSSSGGSSISQATGFAAQLGLNLPIGRSDPEWVYPEIIKSRTLAREMLNRKFDTKKYGLQKPLLQILTYGDNKPKDSQDVLIKKGVKALIGMINIKQSGSLYILTISAFEPFFARDLANALIEELDSHQRKYNKKKTSETRKFIEERISAARVELERAEEVLKVFSDRNRRIENSPALQLERQRLAREVSVLTGVFTTLKQQLETAKIEEVKESDYVVVLDHPEAPLLRSKPRRKFTVIIAGLFGIVFGILMGFIKEFAQNGELEDQKKIYQAKLLIIKNFTEIFTKPFKKNRLVK